MCLYPSCNPDGSLPGYTVTLCKLIKKNFLNLKKDQQDQSVLPTNLQDPCTDPGSPK